MTTSSVFFEPLTLSGLNGLGRAHPPAITVLLPGYAPGAQAKPTNVRLKNAVDAIVHRLLNLGLADREIGMLTAPLLSLASGPAFREGHKNGVAFFLDEEGFQGNEVPGDVPETVVVGNHYYVKPLLHWLMEPREFMVLVLAQGKVSLLNCENDKLNEAPLPRGVPTTLDEISTMETPDHTRINRSGAGRGKGAQNPISFGITSANEERRVQFFCTMVDRGLHMLLQDSSLPLVLAGVDRVVSVYRKENTYPHTISATLRGNIEFLPPEEVVRRARSLIAAERAQEATGYLVEMEEYAPGDRWSTSLYTILRAATQGRVWRLFLAEGASCEGSLKELPSAGELRREVLPIQEDLINVAAVETLCHGGEVFLAAADQLPHQASAAALFRYSLPPNVKEV